MENYVKSFLINANMAGHTNTIFYDQSILYLSVASELTVHNGLLLKGTRIVIPLAPS